MDENYRAALGAPLNHPQASAIGTLDDMLGVDHGGILRGHAGVDVERLEGSARASVERSAVDDGRRPLRDRLSLMHAPGRT